MRGDPRRSSRAHLRARELLLILVAARPVGFGCVGAVGRATVGGGAREQRRWRRRRAAAAAAPTASAVDFGASLDHLVILVVDPIAQPVEAREARDPAEHVEGHDQQRDGRRHLQSEAIRSHQKPSEAI